MPLIETTGQDGISMTVELLPTGLLLVGLGPGGLSGMTLEAVDAATQPTIGGTKPTPHCGQMRTSKPWKGVSAPSNGSCDQTWSNQPACSSWQRSLVALLVVGDPLQATTHVDLQLRAVEHGVPCHVIHGLSITGMVTGAAGLSNYCLAGKPHSPIHTGPGCHFTAGNDRRQSASWTAYPRAARP